MNTQHSTKPLRSSKLRTLLRYPNLIKTWLFTLYHKYPISFKSFYVLFSPNLGTCFSFGPKWIAKKHNFRQSIILYPKDVLAIWTLLLFLPKRVTFNIYTVINSHVAASFVAISINAAVYFLDSTFIKKTLF